MIFIFSVCVYLFVWCQKPKVSAISEYLSKIFKYHLLLYITYFLSTELSIYQTMMTLTKTTRRKVISKHFLRAAIKTKLFFNSDIIHKLLRGQYQHRDKLQYMNSNMLLDHSHKLVHIRSCKRNLPFLLQEDKADHHLRNIQKKTSIGRKKEIEFS